MWTERLTHRLVWANLSDVGLIAVSGNDAETFLQGQLTNDVRQLTQGVVQHNGMCTPKGRLLANFLMWRQSDVTYMQLPQVLQAPIQKRLSMYVLRAKASLSDVHSEMVRIGLAGAEAATLLASLSITVPTVDMHCVSSGSVMCLRLEAERYQLCVPRNLIDTLLVKISEQATDISNEQWEWLEIQAGVPTILPATQEQFVPQMVNLDLLAGINFKKGCYTGQEIVARMHYLGKLKRRMYGVHTSVCLSPGDEIFSADMPGQATGMVVNAQPAPEGGWDALAVVQITSAKEFPLSLKTGEILQRFDLPYTVSLLDA